MERHRIGTAHRINECTHLAPVFRHPISGAIFKGDCGDRQNCQKARNRFRREFQGRLTALTLEPGRPLFLWTFTAAGVRQDTASVLSGQQVDLADPTRRDTWRILAGGLSRTEGQVLRQAKKEASSSYKGLNLVRGHSSARLAIIWVREIGEDGRAHLHTLGDLDFVDHAWLTDLCITNRIGFPQFRRINEEQLRRGRVPQEIASYLSKFAPDDQWYFPKGLRLYGGAKGRLPKVSHTSGFEKWRRRSEEVQSSTSHLTLLPIRPLFT